MALTTHNQGEPVSNACENASTSAKDNSMKKWANDLNRNFTNKEIQIVNQAYWQVPNLTGHQGKHQTPKSQWVF